jgi:hypothetical protein
VSSFFNCNDQAVAIHRVDILNEKVDSLQHTIDRLSYQLEQLNVVYDYLLKSSGEFSLFIVDTYLRRFCEGEELKDRVEEVIKFHLENAKSKKVSKEKLRERIELAKRLGLLNE